jgi:NAD(P)-dependent dehydrogenase (short-subunit alcohol dehydrogenase family)
MANGGKIALITGSNRGIGFETARQLGKQGATVILSSRIRSEAAEAARKLLEEGVEADFIALDVAKATDRSAAAKYLESHFAEPTCERYDARKDIEEVERTALNVVQVCHSGGTSLVAMVQAAHLRYRHDRPDFWPLARARLGRVFAQRQVRSGSMIVIEIVGKNSA